MKTLLGFPVVEIDGDSLPGAAAVISFTSFNRIAYTTWPLNLSITPRSIARLRRCVRKNELRGHGGQAPKARRSKRAKRLL